MQNRHDTRPGKEAAGVNHSVHSALLNVCIIEVRKILH